MSSKILDVQGVTVSFDGFKVLDGLDFSINYGELRFLIGPNPRRATMRWWSWQAGNHPTEPGCARPGTARAHRAPESDRPGHSRWTGRQQTDRSNRRTAKTRCDRMLSVIVENPTERPRMKCRINIILKEVLSAAPTKNRLMKLIPII